MLSTEQKQIMFDVIKDEVHGTEFYNKEMFQELADKVGSIVEELGLLTDIDDATKIDRVNKYLMNNVSIRNEYFEAFREVITSIPDSELVYRTGYAALLKGEAMCAGYTEASRILLEIGGLKTQTLLSKLPGNNKFLLHYVTAIKYDRGSGRDYYIMDPERQHSCEKKGYDFREYLMNMTYIKPNKYFYENKVGAKGVGPRADDFLRIAKPEHVLSKNKVDELFNSSKR